MKKFDESYILLEDMVNDDYYPAFLVDEVKVLVQQVITLLEAGEKNIIVIQKEFDKMTIAINDLEEKFDENDGELETVARESIGATVEYILKWFDIGIDTETAIQERNW